MNVLVTGSMGFIGRPLILKLKSQGINVIEVRNNSEYKNQGQIYSFDLCSKEHVENFLLEKLKIDIIIHTASKLGVASDDNKLSIFHDNIVMYENLSSIIKCLKPKKVINFSSIAVYPNKDGDYNECSEIRPSINNEGMYGLSKFCGENILDFLNKDLKIIHLRIAQVFDEAARDSSIFKIMQKELEETNTVTVFGMGLRVSNFITLDILISKIMLFVEHDISGIFNVGEINLSYKELALEIIRKHGNKDSKIKLVSQGISNRCYINTNKTNLKFRNIG